MVAKRSSWHEFKVLQVILFSPRLSRALLTCLKGGARYSSVIRLFSYVAEEIEIRRFLSIPCAHALFHFVERLRLAKAKVLLCHLQFGAARPVCEQKDLIPPVHLLLLLLLQSHCVLHELQPLRMHVLSSDLFFGFVTVIWLLLPLLLPRETVLDDNSLP